MAYFPILCLLSCCCFDIDILMLFLYAELVNGLLCVLFTRLENNRREVRAVRRVGEVLSLEADGTAARECGSVLAFVAVGPVVCIYLYSGFCGVNLHCASAHRFCYAGCIAQFSLLFLVENEAVVVAGTVLYLLVVGIDVAAYRFG